MRNDFGAFAEWLRQEDDFLLIGHVSPDGDTIGSCAALYGMLMGLNKRVSMCCEQPVPKVYNFLPYTEKMQAVEQLDPKRVYKNAIALDCADMSRMGSAQAFYNNALCKGNIDHHCTNDGYGDFILHDEDVSATGELVFALWKELAKEPDKKSSASKIAECIFTAISTDTGNFAYDNTTASTFMIAAELVKLGADPARINRQVYRTVSVSKTHLKGYVFSNIQLYEEGKIGVVTLLQSDLKRYGATNEDVEGMIDGVRDVDTVEVAILLREARDGTFKASLRSKTFVDVNAIAKQFGGGGHLRAAGCTFIGDRRDIREKLLAAAKKALEKG
ncbi:bifunctional oligoribonuclease/PAP phosphatase NrnA [Eubacteriales bacterium OttesenSCG-928-K08]|nr:bifunctional oligoribonuclease/PAP phosphatase NrnA [Eubacteriales bacterium OttesenSCG-928-K08]